MSFLENVGLNNKVLANGAFDGIAPAVELRSDVFDYDCSGSLIFMGANRARLRTRPTRRHAQPLLVASGERPEYGRGNLGGPFEVQKAVGAEGLHEALEGAKVNTSSKSLVSCMPDWGRACRISGAGCALLVRST